ncbi:Phototropin-1 [Castilleja foliolosa]|uniref:non-specific serine/threonine protein kinase n=1 Tax=Castilleja foliolosa TaxID=1961234 RepID=A0ABD3C5X7_9LAMI
MTLSGIFNIVRQYVYMQGSKKKVMPDSSHGSLFSSSTTQKVAKSFGICFICNLCVIKRSADFIGVQLDGSQHVEPLHNCIAEATATEIAKLVKETAGNVDDAVRELPDANTILDDGEELSLKHFKPIKPLGSGDTGSVHLVEICGTGQHFAMKSTDKGIMLNRNKVHRACAEREILDMFDHPFFPPLYASFQTKTHICLITDYCPGGELFLLLERQPTKVLKEDAVRHIPKQIGNCTFLKILYLRDNFLTGETRIIIYPLGAFAMPLD